MSAQLYEFKCNECSEIVTAEWDIAGDRHDAIDCVKGTLEYVGPVAQEETKQDIGTIGVDEKCDHGVAEDAAQDVADDFDAVSPNTDGKITLVPLAESEATTLASEPENTLEANLTAENEAIAPATPSFGIVNLVSVGEFQGTATIEDDEEIQPSTTTPVPNDFAEPPTAEEMFGSAEHEPTLNDILPDFDSLAAGENVAKETVVLELHVRRPSFRRAFDSRAILSEQSTENEMMQCNSCFGCGQEVFINQVLNQLEPGTEVPERRAPAIHANQYADASQPFTCTACNGEGNVYETDKVKVDNDYIHVSKDIIDRNEIKNINKRIGVLKTYMRTRCVPSSILAAGLYLLPIKFIQEMDTAISSSQTDIEALLNEFEPRYPAMIENAKVKLGPHFNSNDYPQFSVLRAQWRIDAQYRSLNVPAVLQKVSSELFKREAAKCKAQWADTAQEVRDALRVGFTRLVSEFSEKLGNDPETGKPRVFQKGRLEKLRDFLITFEVRDLTGDAELALLASQARQLIDGVDPNKLRKDGEFRTQLETGFAKIAEQAGKMVVVRERILADDED